MNETPKKGWWLKPALMGAVGAALVTWIVQAQMAEERRLMEVPAAPIPRGSAFLQPASDAPPRPGPGEEVPADFRTPDSASVSAPGAPDKDGYLGVPIPYLASFEWEKPQRAGVFEMQQSAAPQSYELKVPEELLAFDGKKVAVEGFMIPLDASMEGVRRFAMVPSRAACCWGVKPDVDEWVIADMGEERRATLYKDMRVTAYGTLRVRPETDEDGWLVGVFSMECDRLKGPFER